MDYTVILQVLTSFFTVIFGFLALYLSSKEKVISKVTEFIAQAEADYKDATKAGGKKFEWVVNQLYNLVPTPFKMFLTKEVLGAIVQYTFDYIEKYATTLLDKSIEKVEEDK